MGVTTRLYSEGLDIDRAVHGLCRAFGTLCLTVVPSSWTAWVFPWTCIFIG